MQILPSMESHEPPVRIIVPGKVYRRDDLDLTHTPMRSNRWKGAGRRADQYGRSQGDVDDVPARAVREGDRDLVPAELFFAHGAERGGVHRLCVLPRRAAALLQEDRVAGNSRQRHGAPVGVFEAGLVAILSVTPGSRSASAFAARLSAEVRRRRYPAALRETTFVSREQFPL